MVIALTPAGQVVLHEPDNFHAFSLRVPAMTDLAAGPLAGVVGVAGPDHVWIAPERVCALVPAAGPIWQQGFDSMVAYAATKGWVDGQGRLRAHVDRVVPA